MAHQDQEERFEPRQWAARLKGKPQLLVIHPPPKRDRAVASGSSLTRWHSLHDLGKIVLFERFFTPYMGRFRYRDENGAWRTNTRRELIDFDIEAAILGRTIVAFYLATMTAVVPVDIDDHEGRAWRGTDASPLLLNLYGQVTTRFRSRPSVLVQSPRGLHAFWMLEGRIPTQIAQEMAERRLHGLPNSVEVRCGPNRPIRIPSEKRLLDAETLLPLTVPGFETVLREAPRYHPAILLGQNCLPDAVIAGSVEKRKRLRVFKNSPRIEEVESKLLPLVNGSTNGPFLTLCQVYRCAGLDEEEAYRRFQYCFARSPQYSGGLRRSRELRARIAWEYKNNRDWTAVPATREPNPDNEEVASRVAAKQPFAPQRTKPVKRFVMRILEWVDWQDEIASDKRAVAVWDYVYPYYRKNRRAGYYPLPSAKLREWNGRYNEIVKWLCEVGFLEPSKHGYSTVRHVCKYYKVRREALQRA